MKREGRSQSISLHGRIYIDDTSEVDQPECASSQRNGCLIRPRIGDPERYAASVHGSADGDGLREIADVNAVEIGA